MQHVLVPVIYFLLFCLGITYLVCWAIVVVLGKWRWHTYRSNSASSSSCYYSCRKSCRWKDSQADQHSRVGCRHWTNLPAHAASWQWRIEARARVHESMTKQTNFDFAPSHLREETGGNAYRTKVLLCWSPLKRSLGI